MSPLLQRSRRWIACVAVVIAVMAVVIAPRFWATSRPAGVPFGCMPIAGSNGVGLQDFAIHLHYLHCIRDRQMEHPYRPGEQEQVVHEWFPTAAEGFIHAYSPITLVLAWPLLLVTPAWAFFLWTIINAALLLALTWVYLLPRMTDAVQGLALLMLLCSYAVLDTLNMGQTAIFTTCLCACGYVLVAGRSRQIPPALGTDLLLALVLYALGFKPSIALVIYTLALGQRAWRPVMIAAAGSALTWIFLAPLYGGYVDGLMDYNWLLGHYCIADVPAFFASSLSPLGGTNLTSAATLLDPAGNGAAFHASRILFEGLLAVVVVLAWSGRIRLSTAFQALIWTFLLFCPYLLLTEDLLLGLLIVEGSFFRNGVGGVIKALLIVFVANIWIGTMVHFPLAFAAKLVLAAWWLAETMAPDIAGNAMDGLRGSAQRLR